MSLSGSKVPLAVSKGQNIVKKKKPNNNSKKNKIINKIRNRIDSYIHINMILYKINM